MSQPQTVAIVLLALQGGEGIARPWLEARVRYCPAGPVKYSETDAAAN